MPTAPMPPATESTLSDDETDLLDYGDSPACIDMDINMVFTVLAEFKVEKEEIVQLCLGPKTVVFEKPEESANT